MKTLRLAALAPLLSLACAASAAGAAELQAVSIGPPGGATQAAAVSSDGRTLYVATPVAGLFRSDDQGATWSRASGGPAGPLDTVAQMAVASGEARTVYAATTEGLFQSRDAGESWRSLNSRVPGVNGCLPATQPCGRAVAVLADPLHPGSLLAAFAGAGLVYRSDDAGETWTRAREGLSSLFVTQLVAVPAQPGTFYAATDHGVRMSRDGGATWSASGLKPVAVVNVAVDAGSDGTAYAITTYEHPRAGLLRDPWRRGRVLDSFSFLLGEHFEPDFGGYLEFTADPFTPGTAFLTTLYGTYRTLDGGLSWLRTDERPTRSVLPAFGAAGTLVAQAGPNEGTPLLLSTDAGASWKQVGPGVAVHAARQLAFDPARPETIYLQAAQGALRRSDDGGRSWRRIFATDDYDGATGFALDPFDPSRLFLAAPHGLYRSSDRGASWTRVYLNNAQRVVGDPVARGTLYALVPGDGVLRSTDGGTNWMRTGTLRQKRFFTLKTQVRRGASTLYAGASELNGDRRTRLWRSENGGVTWGSLLTLRLPEANLTEILTFSTAPRRLVVSFANTAGSFLGPFTDGGVYRSADVGVHWRLSRLDKDRSPALSLIADPTDPGHLFAGSTRGRVFESRDGGASWSPLPAALPPADVRDLQIHPRDPHTLYAALEGASVFRITLDE